MGECQHGRPNHIACPWCEEEAARVKRLIEGHEANYILTKDKARLAALEAVASAARKVPLHKSNSEFGPGWFIDRDDVGIPSDWTNALAEALARLDGEART